MSKNMRSREPMPHQDPKDRITNFTEVALGYSEEQAVGESQRCLNCKKKPCITGCPVEVAIPDFIKLVAERDFKGAITKIKETNALPAICGRVCPQEEQCEKYCILGKRGEPVAIGRLERFVADWEAANNGKDGACSASKAAQSAERIAKVAVVGAGPAGLTAAGELAGMGYDVTVFEALHESGGVLAYGIPPFRLPRTILKREIEYIKSLGASIETNSI
ncbi:MAG: NAD(P)-binding protein, partial [Armatimonadota bacterium]